MGERRIDHPIPKNTVFGPELAFLGQNDKAPGRGGGGGGPRSHTKDVPWFLPSFVTFAESKIIWNAKHGQGQCNAPQQSLKMQKKCNISSMDRTKAAELTNIALCLAKASNLDIGSAFHTCSNFMDEEPEG